MIQHLLNKIGDEEKESMATIPTQQIMHSYIQGKQ